MKRTTVCLNGQELEIWCERLGDQLWYHFEGETFSYQPTKSQRGNSRGEISHAQVTAPMPGKVIKVMVDLNEPVKVGQPVIVMEAMKMEYTLEAQANGFVERINCEPGNQVALGFELLSVGQVNGKD